MLHADAAGPFPRPVPAGQWLAFWALCAGALVAGVAGHGQAATRSPALVAATWAAMVVGMMVPTAVPALQAFAARASARQRRFRPATFWAFAGYLGVWITASLGFTTAQLAAGAFPSTPAPFALACLLAAAAGAYQFTPLKQSCARRCRAPLARWRDGTAGAGRLGARHGVDCLGCCAALMLLALAGGALQPLIMACVMLAVAAEKLPRVGERLTRPLATSLLVAGAALLVAGFAI